MNDNEQVNLYSKIRQDDNFLNHLFNNDENKYLNIFYLINRIIFTLDLPSVLMYY